MVANTAIIPTACRICQMGAPPKNGVAAEGYDSHKHHCYTCHLRSLLGGMTKKWKRSRGS
jgi:hypothetical protein